MPNIATSAGFFMALLGASAFGDPYSDVKSLSSIRNKRTRLESSGFPSRVGGVAAESSWADFPVTETEVASLVR